MHIIIALAVVGLIGFFVYRNVDWRSPERKRADYQALAEKAKSGDERAQYQLLMLYYEERDPQYWPLAFEWALFVANKGEDPGVMVQAGEMLAAGDGTEQNEPEALKWYERALSVNIALGPRAVLDKEEQNELEKLIFRMREKYPPQI